MVEEQTIKKMNAKEIAKWVIDNRYSCNTISDEEMYKIVLNEINSNFEPIEKCKHEPLSLKGAFTSCKKCKMLLQLTP